MNVQTHYNTMKMPSHVRLQRVRLSDAKKTYMSHTEGDTCRSLQKNSQNDRDRMNPLILIGGLQIWMTHLLIDFLYLDDLLQIGAFYVMGRQEIQFLDSSICRIQVREDDEFPKEAFPYYWYHSRL